MAACETDYGLMSGWFGSTGVTGMTVQVTPRSNGAHWFGSSGSSTVRLYPGGASYTGDPVYLRYLMVSEITEIFMMNQNAGWFQSGDEGSKGEGLSRFLGARFLDVNGFAELQLRTDYGTARLWLNSPRGDYVNNAPDDNGYDAVNGCTALFIWYLFTQFGFSETQIVAAAASTLAGVYRNLTGDNGDAFPFFKSLLDFYYPSTTSSAIAGPNPDNPWPLTFASFWVRQEHLRPGRGHRRDGTAEQRVIPQLAVARGGRPQPPGTGGGDTGPVRQRDHISPHDGPAGPGRGGV